MVQSRARAFVLLLGVCVWSRTDLALAQTPVAAMFADDQKRDVALASSFARVELPPATTATAPLHVYLSAGDLERALAIYRADAQHADITRRAGALARLARVASKLNRPDPALDSYDALARLRPRVAALGRPADLVGTLQRSAVLADAGRRDELHTAARAIDHPAQPLAKLLLLLSLDVARRAVEHAFEPVRVEGFQ